MRRNPKLNINTLIWVGLIYYGYTHGWLDKIQALFQSGTNGTGSLTPGSGAQPGAPAPTTWSGGVTIGSGGVTPIPSPSGGSGNTGIIGGGTVTPISPSGSTKMGML